MKRVLAAVAMLGLAAPAQAEWLRARSRHFVIYSDTKPDTIRQLATRLEQVDGALRAISGMKDTEESAANPVTVYVLDDLAAIRRLARNPNVGGFYQPRATGAVAFTPRRGDGGRATDLSPQIVLFHEYAHHFLLSNSLIAYPAWLSEGYAEFVSTARFSDESLQIGGAANHRAYGLFADRELPLRTLFAPGPNLSGQEMDQLYGRGWLLTHYLLLGGRPRDQLLSYISALNKGVAPLKAATDAFGDLGALDRELDRYLKRRKLQAFTIGNDRLGAASIDVRPLSAGEQALIDMRIVSTRGVDDKSAGPLYARAVKAAQPFASDAVVQGWLAEMAYDAGRDDEAEAAADRALAADPKSIQALLYKGRVRLRRAAAGSADAKAWAEARSWIIKANRVDPNGAAALSLFYDSFEMERARPSKSAIAGLHRAVELAPQDPGLRFQSARQHLIDGQLDDAKRTLRPLAFSPHVPAGNPAARLLAMVESGSTGPAALDALAAEEKKADEKDEKPKASAR